MAFQKGQVSAAGKKREPFILPSGAFLSIHLLLYGFSKPCYAGNGCNGLPGKDRL